MNFLLNTTPTIDGDTWSTVIETLISWCLNTGIKIVISLIILAVSFRLINVLVRRLEKRMQSNEKHDKTIVKVLN